MVSPNQLLLIALSPFIYAFPADKFPLGHGLANRRRWYPASILSSHISSTYDIIFMTFITLLYVLLYFMPSHRNGYLCICLIWSLYHRLLFYSISILWYVGYNLYIFHRTGWGKIWKLVYQCKRSLSYRRYWSYLTQYDFPGDLLRPTAHWISHANHSGYDLYPSLAWCVTIFTPILYAMYHLEETKHPTLQLCSIYPQN